MNSNAFHQVANIITLVLAGAQAVLMASGCVATASGGIDCAASSIPPTYTMAAIAAIQAAKMIVNVVRDGFGGLFKPQPPVEK